MSVQTPVSVRSPVISHHEVHTIRPTYLRRLDGGIQQQEMGLSKLNQVHQQREHQLMYTSRTLHESTQERTAMLERQKRHIAMLHNMLYDLKVYCSLYSGRGHLKIR